MSKQYLDRERQDYGDDRQLCFAIRENIGASAAKFIRGEQGAHDYYGTWIQGVDNALEFVKLCKLPDDCELCERYICNCCEKTTSWACGGADDMGGVCDDCFMRLSDNDQQEMTCEKPTTRTSATDSPT